MFFTKLTILIKLQPRSGLFFILCCRIISSLTVTTSQNNNISHNLFAQNKIYPRNQIFKFLNPTKPYKTEPTIGIEPMTSSLPRKCSTTELRGRDPKTSVTRLPIPDTLITVHHGAGNGTRTRDPQLGRLTL